jgi:rhodanese-related sulfurtransferase
MNHLRYKSVLLAIFLCLVACTPEWDSVKATIRRKFPEVHQVTTSQLADQLAATNKSKPVLLDVRTEAEYAVSQLSDACRIDPDSSAAQVNMNKDTPIVTYCSVGYRSSAFAQKLKSAGYTNVSNLEGSIFQWANEGRPIVSADGPAKKVHPYNARWGQLLNAPLRANVPPAD